MSKISELSEAVAELRRCGEALIGVSESLRGLFGGEPAAEESSVQEPAKEETPSVTLERVRAVLAEKSLAGHRAEVQALIRGCGADRLSTVDPSKYEALLKRAEVL
jgi:hypothetical protein